MLKFSNARPTATCTPTISKQILNRICSFKTSALCCLAFKHVSQNLDWLYKLNHGQQVHVCPTSQTILCQLSLEHQGLIQNWLMELP